MDRKVIELELTPEERRLILRHGYPFDDIRKALEACQASKTIKTVRISAFELERLIGDLCITINELDLCDRLEAAERYGDGRLDWI